MPVIDSQRRAIATFVNKIEANRNGYASVTRKLSTNSLPIPESCRKANVVIPIGMAKSVAVAPAEDSETGFTDQ